MKKFMVDLSDEHYKSIGRIMVYFNLLEEQVANCIRVLIGVEQDTGRIMTTELSFSQKVALLSSVYRHLSNSIEEPKELKKLLSRLGQAEEKRNYIVHSMWIAGILPEKTTRIKITAKRRTGLRSKLERMTVQDLDEIADFIGGTSYDVFMFTFRHALVLRE